MKLYEIGERKIVRDILSILQDESAGDDSAYIPLDDHYLLVTSDIIRKKDHLPDVMTPRDIGWFVTAINLSDIAAMGGSVIGILLSMSLPSNLEEEFVLSIIEGAKDCIEKFGGKILGGDTKEHEEITISGTAIGIVPKDEILLRKGAKPGDIIAVTGTLGKAVSGLLAIKNEFEDISKEYLINPVPRLKEGREIAKHKLANACMDISDGLASSLYQLSEINGVGFRIYRDKIPVDKLAFEVGKRLEIDSYSLAIDYGGDYELLFIISKDKFEEAKKRIKLYDIGEVTESKDVKIVCHGIERELKNRGYEHFIGNWC